MHGLVFAPCDSRLSATTSLPAKLHGFLPHSPCEPGTSAQQHMTTLFCTPPKVKLLAFLFLRTLSQKHPGGVERKSTASGAFAVRKSRYSQLVTRPSSLESHPCTDTSGNSQGITSL